MTHKVSRTHATRRVNHADRVLIKKFAQIHRKLEMYNDDPRLVEFGIDEYQVRHYSFILSENGDKNKAPKFLKTVSRASLQAFVEKYGGEEPAAEQGETSTIALDPTPPEPKRVFRKSRHSLTFDLPINVPLLQVVEWVEALGGVVILDDEEG